jgi:hypothetical protein
LGAVPRWVVRKSASGHAGKGRFGVTGKSRAQNFAANLLEIAGNFLLVGYQ